MGQDITEIVKLFFRDRCLLKRINGAFIVLIPKKKNQNTNDLRPISLCNVIYKIISKVVALGLRRSWIKVYALLKVLLLRVGI